MHEVEHEISVSYLQRNKINWLKRLEAEALCTQNTETNTLNGPKVQLNDDRSEVLKKLLKIMGYRNINLQQLRSSTLRLQYSYAMEYISYIRAKQKYWMRSLHTT